MSKSYNSMSITDRKIAIAKDVIANIYANTLTIKDNSGYVVAKNNSDYDEDDISVLKKYFDSQKIAEMLKGSCEVCARGAMMLCKVSKFNNYEFGDEIYSADTTDALSDAFDDFELYQIESAFEGKIMSSMYDLEDGDFDELNEMYEAWLFIRDPKDRMLAIMQNLIDHNGKFKPEVLYEAVWDK